MFKGMTKIVSPNLFSIGFAIGEAAKTQTSIIGGHKVKEKKGLLTRALGKPALSATSGEKKKYIANAPNKSEKAKRVARVNLAAAHKKGHKAQGHKI